MKPMRILIVAEHASARFGGEAFLPLHYFRVLRSRGIEAWLLVHSRTRAELQQVFPEDSARIFYIEDTWLHKLLYQASRLLPRRIGEATLGQLSHLYTQIAQRGRAMQLVRELGIDLVHEPIPVSPKTPSLMFGLGAPVVIGPMNGGMDYPAAFRGQQSAVTSAVVHAGRAFSHVANQWLPGKLEASALLVANVRTRLALPSGVRGKVIELVENGVDLSVWRAPRVERSADGVVRFIFIGRLVDWKAVDLLLEAFASVRGQINARLEIIGDGAMRAAWTQLAGKLGLADAVQFSGWLSQAECAERLAASDVFMLPSLFECGGAVVLEAMALGLPVIATDWGGPADYLDETCGILVPPDSRAALVAGFAAAMTRLAGSAELREQMGGAGREKILRVYDWERKVDQVLEIYRAALGQPRSTPLATTALP